MREIKFRVWLGKRFWFFDITSGFNAENKGQVSNPEQYTGLKDKNGVEIYEGDIIANDNGAVSEVVFWEGAFCLDFSNGLTHFNSLTNFAPIRTKTVIGNIHENPELLDTKS